MSLTVGNQRTGEHFMNLWDRWGDGATNVAVIVAFLVIWQILAVSPLTSSKYLVSPIQTVEQFFVLVKLGYAGTSLYEQFMASFLRVLIGYCIAVVIGVPLGLLMGMSKVANNIFSPIFAILRPIPTIAFIPLIIMWLGIGEASKLTLISMTTLIFLVLAVSAGVASVPGGLKRAALNLGANKIQLFFDVLMPGSLPSIFAGLRIALGVAWSILMAAELVAAQKGLGYMILDASEFLRIRDVYVGIVIIGAVGLISDQVIFRLGRRLVHWEGK